VIDYFPPHTPGTMTIADHVALHSAAVNLGHEFHGIYGPETIERFLHESYKQLAVAGGVPTFLPLLAERFSRQRLHALARIEGHHRDRRPVVLFVCAHNAGRSQMALGFFTRLARDNAVACSGGSEPGPLLNPFAVAAMAERGINIRGAYPKPWTDEVVGAADVVITMGCGDACPVFAGIHYENWDVRDPADLDIQDVRRIRDDIERRVFRLLSDLKIP